MRAIAGSSSGSSAFASRVVKSLGAPASEKRSDSTSGTIG
jgi:hypothetical protein